MSHNHSTHNHAHSTSNNLLFAFLLNFGFAIIEVIGGIYTGSTAILADSVHDLGDSVSLGLSYFLEKKSLQTRSSSFSFGYRRFSLLGGLISGLVLIVGSVFVLTEAVPKLFNPGSPNADGMILLALLGILINGLAAFRSRNSHNLNEKVISWHLLEDLFGWIAVLIVSLIMKAIYLPILDPILSIAITSYTLYNVGKIFIQIGTVFLQAVPQDIDLTKITTILKENQMVLDFHDLHIWSLDGQKNILTVHLVLKNTDYKMDQLLELKNQIKENLKHAKIEHATLETEIENENCELNNC